MKKIFALILALVMCLSLAACGAKAEAPEVSQPPVETPSGSVEGGNSPAEEQPESGDGAADNAPAEGLTMGQTLLADFSEQLAADPAAGAQQIADTLLTNPVIEFSGASMPVEPGLLTGFGNEEITGFKEGVMFGPIIGSIPFIGYIFVLEDGADLNAFTEALSAGANPMWNICVEAEETVIDSVGNTVFFLMCPGPNQA